MKTKSLLISLAFLMVACGGRSKLFFDEFSAGSGGASSGGASGAGATDGAGGLGGAGPGTGASSGSGGADGGSATGGVGFGAAASGGRLGSGGASSGGAGSGGVANSGGAASGGASASGGTFGAGGSSTCLDVSDCPSPDPCLMPLCTTGKCEFEIRDRDADGYHDRQCGGGDCNDLNPLARPGAAEDCFDGTDNDCNGLTDCFDPSCASEPSCGCTPVSVTEICQNGNDDDCDGKLDCLDADCIGTAVCGCGSELCGNGIDDDCDGNLDCDDDDCSVDEACSCSGALELCRNGIDDDCDGRIDCADPSCSFSAECLCVKPQIELCADGRDNDCDGLADCADPDCLFADACSSCSSENCSGQKDEDCDGLVDCSDPSCAFDPACPARPESCNNQLDDDFDGLIDCDDADCSNVPLCIEKQNTCLTARTVFAQTSSSWTGDTTGQLSNFEGSCGGDAGEAVFVLTLNEPSRLHIDTIGSSFDTNLYVRAGNCSLGTELGCDDDGGGFAWSSALDFALLAPGTYYIFVDGLTVDPSFGVDEGPYVLNVEVGSLEEVCDDGVDNDGNRFADCVDPACEDAPLCLSCAAGDPPRPEFGVELCTDGIDNDCDGVADCQDDDCSANLALADECCDGVDDNGNGIEDDFSCRCQSDDDCSFDQVCYTRTLGACGLPCDSFVGELCPFFAPGSYCNPSSQQCEF